MGVVMGLLSCKVHKQARKLGVSYSFLFMHANGAQLCELATLYDAGHSQLPLVRHETHQCHFSALFGPH